MRVTAFALGLQAGAPSLLLDRDLIRYVDNGIRSVFAGSRLQILSQPGIGCVNVAAFHAARHERAIRVLDYFIGQSMGAFGVFFLHLLQAFD